MVLWFKPKDASDSVSEEDERADWDSQTMLVPCKELLKRIKVAKPTTMRAIDLGTVIVAATVQGGMVGFKGLKY